MRGTILSGIQPTGTLTLGNYLGAIQNWVRVQHDYTCFFFIVDLHAITVPQDPNELAEATYKTAATYLACGIDPKASTLFVQSHVHAHAELQWILSCFTPIGWLNRMIQFKDKAGKNKEKASAGLYTYPVLQAADILLYQATHVPVGEDQKQHVELTRDIAQSFNQKLGVDLFTLPEYMPVQDVARVMSLRDGTKKMSKSDPSDMSRINLTDSAELVEKKIKKATTDSIEGISYDPEVRPEISNLIRIFANLSGTSKEAICDEYASASNATFKSALAELLVAHFAPISENIQRLLRDRAYLGTILAQGSEKASMVANTTLNRVKDTIGLIRLE